MPKPSNSRDLSKKEKSELKKLIEAKAGNPREFAKLLFAVENTGVDPTEAQLAAVVQRLERVFEGQVSLTPKTANGIAAVLGLDYGELLMTLRGKVAGEPSSDDWHQDFRTCQSALTPYLRVVTQVWRQLPLIGLDPKASDAELGGRLTLDAVYTSLDTTLSQGNIHPDIDTSEEKEPVSAALGTWHFHNSVVLGDPGAGKSTFCNHLCWTLASHLLAPESPSVFGLAGWSGTTLPHYPIILLLRVFSRKQAAKLPDPSPTLLWNFLVQEVRERDPNVDEKALVLAARKGWLLVCFDGADEVPPDRQAFVRGCIETFCQCYQSNRFILTCRIVPWQKLGWSIPRFTVLPLAEFDDEKIQGFVAAWYDTHRSAGRFLSEEAAERAEGLRSAVLHREELRRFAGNPMLLTVMALLHTHRGRLPDDRTRLYQDVVEHLLLRWDDSRKIAGEEYPGIPELLRKAGQKADENSLQRALAEAAFEAHQNCPAGARKEGSADIHMDRLRAIFRKLHTTQSADWAEEVVRTIQVRSGILIPREEEVFCFPHRSFQEFMAALHLSKMPRWQREAAKLVEETGYWREVIKWAGGRVTHIVDAPEQTILLLRELCPEAEPVSDVDWRKLTLAAEVLLEAHPDKLQDFDDGPGTVERIRRRLVRLVETSTSGISPLERARGGECLGRLGDPRLGVGLDPATNLPDIDFILPPLPAGEFKLSYNGQTVKIDAPYRIARYPVTCAQFQAFVDQRGYGDPSGPKPSWWTDEGWEWRTSRNETGSWEVSGPANFHPVFNTPNHPKVGVSWHEATAFCKWLTEKWTAAGKLVSNEKIRPPSNAEWEQAARWNAVEKQADLRLFPWGDDGTNVAGRCNVRKTAINHTCAVGLFPSGVSECGAFDLLGNVWELCVSMRFRVGGIIRGAPWSGIGSNGLLHNFGISDPAFQSNEIGFRCVLGSWDDDLSRSGKKVMGAQRKISRSDWS